ncbi:FecR family protein [Chitinophaga japonensis]|uniref:FecR family protein n=1 Tax=Chitinophaga japonensis TaxID=104662 RepID=A0A562SU40_CHIJA|nr:FecR family protein [Chitinophaga japonensis]TWI84484.1 FecR family protein [Chitinophaga japonensis]
MIRSAVQKLIDRYLEGRADAREEALVTGWLDQVAAESPYPGKDLDDKEKEKLRRQLLAAIRRKTGQQQRIHRLRWQRAGIAAAVVSVLCAGYLLLRFLSTPAVPVYEIVRTGVGEKKLMTLPDGSRVWLAPNSELQYPEDYMEQRHVKLTAGEAFFDVTHNAEQHFTVMADSLQIEVLGTSFNVRAYQKLPDWLVAVSSGKVKVSRNQRVLGALSEGQQMRILRGNDSIARSNITAAAVDGWMHNRIEFEKTPLSEVLYMLQHYYPVTFTLREERPLLISGSLDMRLRIEQVIAVLEELGNHHIQFQRQTATHYIVK